MLKDFDTWNSRKKLIHSELDNLPYKERQIWWCSIGVNVGFEEDGDGERAERPVVIVKGFSRELCWVIPLSTKQKKNPYYMLVGNIDETPASAIISQMKPIDTKRFINCIGLMDFDIFIQMKKAVKDML